MPPFGGGVKPSAPCHKCVHHVKEAFEVQQEILHWKNSFSSPCHPLLLLDAFVGHIARELWWTNEEFSPVDIIASLFSMLIYHLENG
jgi:hypothetical protein